jgi:hypothetical protein
MPRRYPDRRFTRWGRSGRGRLVWGPRRLGVGVGEVVDGALQHLGGVGEGQAEPVVEGMTGAEPRTRSRSSRAAASAAGTSGGADGAAWRGR